MTRPTQVKYLDPIFYIWALGGKELLTRSLPKGLNSISDEADKKVIDQWMLRYSEDIWTHISERKETNHFINDLIKNRNNQIPLQTFQLFRDPCVAPDSPTSPAD